MPERPREPETKTKREISAGFIVYRRTQEGPKFLLLYHGHNYWNFAKGKIESEERSLRTALRETKEEAGLSERDLRIVNNFKAYERFSFRRNNQPIFKIVIFYMAETHKAEIKISDEHQGYGWFLFSEARKILSRYQDSQKVLKQAYDYLRTQSARRSGQNTSRQGTNLQRSGPPRR